MAFDFLINNRSTDSSYEPLFSNIGAPLLFTINDEEYGILINKYLNGGFFFNDALLLYTHSINDRYPSIITINEAIASYFGNLFDGFLSFGQDVFGNQFCFKKDTSNIYLFNIEDSKVVFQSHNFKEWIELLEADYDFIVGQSYMQDWKARRQINEDERLCPKIPFIIGGDYKTDNFYTCSFPNYLKFYSEIAKQIINLPDGTPVKLKIIPPSSS